MKINFGREICYASIYMEYGYCFISSDYYESDETVLEEILELVKEHSYSPTLPKLTVYDGSYGDMEIYHVVCGELEATVTYTDHIDTKQKKGDRQMIFLAITVLVCASMMYITALGLMIKWVIEGIKIRKRNI